MRPFLFVCLISLAACAEVQTGAGQALDNAGSVIESGLREGREKIWTPRPEHEEAASAAKADAQR